MGWTTYQLVQDFWAINSRSRNEAVWSWAFAFQMFFCCLRARGAVTVAGVSQSVNLRSTEDSNDSDADEKISDEEENNEDNIGTSMMVQGGTKV